MKVHINNSQTRPAHSRQKPGNSLGLQGTPSSLWRRRKARIRQAPCTHLRRLTVLDRGRLHPNERGGDYRVTGGRYGLPLAATCPTYFWTTRRTPPSAASRIVSQRPRAHSFSAGGDVFRAFPTNGVNHSGGIESLTPNLIFHLLVSLWLLSFVLACLSTSVV